ncbi:hypothetical protein FOZ63_021778, partial [Perkinsus olseni]
VSDPALEERHQPFSGETNGSSVAKLAHEWASFCATQWLDPCDPAAVRSFLGGALSSKLSAQIRSGYESFYVADYKTRSYHRALFQFAMDYLRAHHSAPVSATQLLHRFLANKQGGRALQKFLDEVDATIWEMRYIFENNHQAPLDIGYIASSIVIGLDEPYKGWFYDEILKRYGESMPKTFDGLVDVLRALRRRCYVLGTGMNGTTTRTPAERTLVPLVNQVSTTSPNPLSSTGPQVAPAETSSQSVDQHPKGRDGKPSPCKRCYSGSHPEEACTAEVPKDIAHRCRCGSRRHAVDKCPMNPVKIKCSRCLGDPGLPQQQPHRSGVCPYSLEQIRSVRAADGTLAVVHDDSSPPVTAPVYSKSIVYVDGQVSSTPTPTTCTEIYAIDLKGPSTPGQVAVSRELRTSIIVGYPGCLETASVSCLWDTGATATLVRADVLDLLDKKNLVSVSSCVRQSRSSSVSTAVLADNTTRMSIQGTCRLVLRTENAVVELEAFVTNELGCPLILGIPALRALRVRLEFAADGIKITTGVPDIYADNVLASPVPTCRTCSLTDTGQPSSSQSGGLGPLGTSDCSGDAIDLPPSHLAALGRDPHPRLVTPSDCISIETTRTGRFAVDFWSEDLESVAGSGWSATVARARRSAGHKTEADLSLIREALRKLEASHFVSSLTLRSLARPPPKRVISHLYQNNKLIKDTHLAHGDWLLRYHPVFVPSQFVLKASSASTPCRVVYDCREVNKALKRPSVTRWDLLRYLVWSCTRPVVSFADLAKAFNQVAKTGEPPELYSHSDFEHAYPVLSKAFSNSPEVLDALQASFPSDLGWRDYVDDWMWALYHIRQLFWAKTVSTSVANFRGFCYADGKESDSWEHGRDAPLLGYRLRDDRICTVVDVPDLTNGASKRDLSKCLSSHYDPLGRHIELSMYSRAIWRKVVTSINNKAVPTDISWRCRVPAHLVEEANEWLRLARSAPPSPRFVPLSSGPFCDIPCYIIISCDASAVAWAIDVRSRLEGYPLSPRLKARGGMFPSSRRALEQAASLEATIPRKELHGLLQGAAEAYYLCSTLKLGKEHRTEVYILSDSLINIQRLSWLSGKSKEVASRYIGKKGKHQFSERDLDRLIRIRDYLWRWLKSHDQPHRSSCPKSDVTAILLITCAATGFIQACLIKGPVTSSAICDCLDATFSSSITPSIVLSDNDGKFCASFAQKWCKARRVVHCFAPPYSPLLCLWERGHREVTRCLRSCINDSGDYGEGSSSSKPWHTLVLECVDVLNGSPYSSVTWLSPRMLVFPYFSESEYYSSNPSADDILNKMTAFTTPGEAKKVRDEARASYRLKLLDYLRHWSSYRETSRARVLAGQGRECNLQVADKVYHLTNASASSKLASRVQGPFQVDAFEASKGTAVLSGSNGSKFRAWVGNLVKVPDNEFVDAEPISPPCPWSLDSLPPITVLPPPPQVLPTWPPLVSNSSAVNATSSPTPGSTQAASRPSLPSSTAASKAVSRSSSGPPVAPKASTASSPVTPPAVPKAVSQSLSRPTVTPKA